MRAQVGRGDRSRCKPGHDVGLQRYFMDKLIQHYLAHVNHHYCILHPQQFLEEYAQWWEDRENQNLLSVESSCLILRVCALATLTLSPETKKEIEAGSNHPIEVLSERLHEQAQELKTIILSEKGGLIHVQQLMLSVQWFWSKSQPDKAWDSLAEAIKEAQDQGRILSTVISGRHQLIHEHLKAFIWKIGYKTWTRQEKKQGVESGISYAFGIGRSSHSTINHDVGLLTMAGIRQCSLIVL